LDQFFGNNNSNGFPDTPTEEQILETEHNGQNQTLPSTSILEYCRTTLSSNGIEMPVLQNNASWSDNFPDWYGKAWQSKNAHSLESHGVCTIGDLALLISALKLRIEWVADGLPLVSIAAHGPDGISVEFQKVGKWGWRMILYVLEQHGFDWRAHVTNQEELQKVRYPMT
jgi:hypothetical protein